MGWFPIGPDFVFAPRNGSFKRLSLRNEEGRQGLVSDIALDETDPQTLYVVERPSSGGSTAFRTRDGGRTWTPIADALQQANADVDPSCLAVNTTHPEILYLGTRTNESVYVSTNRGEPASWGARNPLPNNANVRKLIVDPRTAATPATTVLYAATTAGVYRSPDGGATWTRVLTGDVWTLQAHMPATGTDQFYAGVYGTGVFHTTNPTGTWTNLNAAGIGLPARSIPDPVADPLGNWETVLVDYCRLNPTRAYAWFLKGGQTVFLYTTSAPSTSWTQIPMTLPPSPWYGYYAMSFGVAPNSPGNGTSDILFFGSGGIDRSIDAGRNWQSDAVWYHADQHAIAFSPASPAAGVIPRLYIGCDGGIAASDKLADPTYAIATAPPHYNEGDTILDSGAWTNRNHGKQSSAVYQYASPPTVPSLSYIGCQDTGVNAGDGQLGWRGIANADGGALAASAGPTGVSLWALLGAFAGWPGFAILRWIDRGEFAPAANWVTFSGSQLAGTTNYVTGLDGLGLAGAVVRADAPTTLLAAITGGAAAQAATPASMTGIVNGARLWVGEGTGNAERVLVTATTGTTFSAVFNRNHAIGDPVVRERAHVFRMRHDATALPISQDLANWTDLAVVAASPTDPNILYCGRYDQSVFSTNAGAAAGAGTVWTEVTLNHPLSYAIADIEVTTANEAFVLTQFEVTQGAVTSPLFRVSAGSWEIQQCSGAPSGFIFGKLVADPTRNDVLYASHRGRVYRLDRSGGVWTWTDISDGLPGPSVYDLLARQISFGESAKTLLRAAVTTRGVFEADVTEGAVDPASYLYVRDNRLDTGWLTPSTEGQPDPYDPATILWHYMCADIKIDARQNRPAPGAADFYQTDPETPTIPPLDHTLFDELKDNSQNLPQTDQAWVHVQVHNRSRTALNNVSVWAVYCNASGGVPSLAASPTMGPYAFWSQFTAAGTIVPSLPSDSPWKSVGPPRVLNGIDAAHPQIASWNWTVPILSTGDPGHFCMAVFIHAPSSLIGESVEMSVDALAPRNRQIGQKNLHVGPPLPPVPSPRGPGGGPAGSSPHMVEYVEFHNPTAAERIVDLVFDLTSLPPQLAVSLQLTPLDTTAPLGASLDGVASTHTAPAGGGLLQPVKHPGLLEHLLRFILLLICFLLNLVRYLLGRPRKPCRRPTVSVPAFEPTIYVTEPSQRVAVRGVRLGPFAFVAAAVAVENTGRLEPESQYVFEVQQWLSGEDFMAGGGRYVVVTGGESKDKRKPIVAPTHDRETTGEEIEALEKEAERFRYIPPFARQIVEEREREQHKDT